MSIAVVVLWRVAHGELQWNQVVTTVNNDSLYGIYRSYLSYSQYLLVLCLVSQPILLISPRELKT